MSLRLVLLCVGLLSLASSGCDSGVECGEGTAEEGGKCVPTVVAAACPEGTVDDNGTCVIDLDAARELLKPVVQSVKLISLSLDESRPVLAEHPLVAAAVIEVDGDAFSSMVVFGLDDGDKSCIIGSTLISHTPDDGSGVAQIRVSDEFYVQKDCASLDGATAASLWVAFDPFQDVNVVGRSIPVPDVEPPSLTPVIKQSVLPLDDCTPPGDSSHPETCATAVEVHSSPGKDVVLSSVALENSVTVFQTAFSENPGTGPSTDTDADLDTPEPPEPFTPPVLTKPHFTVTADMVVFGQDESEQATAGDEVSLSFAMRPIVPAGAEGLVSDDLLDWEPLAAKETTAPDKAGDPPSWDYLEEQFLDSLSGPTTVFKTSPVYITGGAEQLMRGPWSIFDEFELRVCATAAFTEQGHNEDPTANNCWTRPVVVLSKHVTPTGGGVDGLNALNSSTTSKSYGSTVGSASTIEVELSTTNKVSNNPTHSIYPHTELRNTTGLYVNGHFPMKIVDGSLYGQLGHHKWNVGVANTGVDFYGVSLSVMGVWVGISKIPLPSDISAGTPKPICKAGKCAQWDKKKEKCHAYGLGFGLGIDVCLGAQVSAAMEVAFAKKTTVDGSLAAATCNGGSGEVVSGGRCFKGFKGPATFQQARSECAKKGMALARPATKAQMVAAGSSLSSASPAASWGWIDFAKPTCPKMAFQAVPFDYPPLPYANVYEYYNALGLWAAIGYDDMEALCQSTWGNSNTWRASEGNQTLPSDATWVSGQPNGSTNGQTAIELSASGAMYDYYPSRTSGYVCESIEGGASTTFSVGLGPALELSGLGSASLSIGVAKGGLELELNLIKINLIAWIDLGVASTANNIELIFGGRGIVTLETLSGQLWAKVWTRTWPWSDWGNAEKQWSIFAWNGITLWKERAWEW